MNDKNKNPFPGKWEGLLILRSKKMRSNFGYAYSMISKTVRCLILEETALRIVLMA